MIVISDIGLLAMLGVVTYWIQASSLATVVKYYTIPYLLANHWIVMLTYVSLSNSFALASTLLMMAHV